MTERLRRLAAGWIICATLIGNPLPGWAQDEETAWELANVPVDVVGPLPDQPVLVAVVDDGFRLSHEALKDFIAQNPLETPENDRDDDGNGFRDDITGWDLSDGDNDVTPPPDRLEQYSHGTQIASIVTQIARRAWGSEAPTAIRILPIKAMSDDAEKPYLREGFAGIRYAVDAGADIVIAAWGVNLISEDERRVLEYAMGRDVTVVAAAGNFPQEIEQYPAAFRPVLAVAATDPGGRKLEASAYGQFVDLTAPGSGIRAASAIADDAWETVEGTSYAAAIAGAAAALVRVANPGFTRPQVDACLKSSAIAAGNPTPAMHGKLGSGKLDTGSAIECSLLRDPPRPRQILTAPKGYLHLRAPSAGTAEWVIESTREINGIQFWPERSGAGPGGGRLTVRAGRPGRDRPVAEHDLTDLPERIFVADRTALVRLEVPTSDSPGDSLLEYEFDTIDFSRRYCSGTQRIRAEGIIEDGSGERDYAPGSDCKWLISAPPGHLIHLRFLEFDTEPKTDFIYLFDGAGTHETIMARLSGPALPPEVTSWGNEALLWFVTDREIQGKGWKAEITFSEPKP